MTVCSGTALLARTGLLDGRRATTNKMFFHEVAQEGPRVEWIREARWVEDGKYATSSGVSAGIDMALAVIAKLVGPQISDSLAIADRIRLAPRRQLGPVREGARIGVSGEDVWTCGRTDALTC